MKFLFHWPLRDPTVSSSERRVRGARRRCWCVNVRLREQEATGGHPIFTLNQWSRSSTMSEVLFRRCGIGQPECIKSVAATYTNTPNPAATTGNHNQ